MSQNQGNSSNRRSGRGGQRRNRDRAGDSNQDYRPHSEPSAPPEKPSFFQKILGIFKPKKAAPVSTNGQSRSGGRGNTTVTSHYPDTPPRAPREPRENRDGRDRDGRQNRDNREEREPRDRDNRESREPSAPRPSRKPEAVEVTTPKLYVGNLSFDASEAIFPSSLPASARCRLPKSWRT